MARSGLAWKYKDVGFYIETNMTSVLKGHERNLNSLTKNGSSSVCLVFPSQMTTVISKLTPCDHPINS